MAIFYYPKRIPRLRTDAHNKLIRNSKRHILHTAVDLYHIAETGSRDSQLTTLRPHKDSPQFLDSGFSENRAKTHRQQPAWENSARCFLRQYKMLKRGKQKE
nr:MAG TPA: hypothetical protein [Caudoviricetes sp.]